LLINWNQSAFAWLYTLGKGRLWAPF